MAERLSGDLKREVHRQGAKGRSLREIGQLVESAQPDESQVVVREFSPKTPEGSSPALGRLVGHEREEIRAGLERQESFTLIASTLGRATSTISREVAANGGRAAYAGWQAHQRAQEQARRPTATKLSHKPLAKQVTGWLKLWWSPEEIANRLRIEFPDDPMMRVSYETIYQTLFVQGRGELRAELYRCLRSGRARRRPKSRIETRGTIPNKVMLSERPAEADDRVVPGHWEGDLVIGQADRSAVGTLVERTSSFLVLLHLPDGRAAELVNDAMAAAIAELPDELARSITWDQGKEMSSHERFSIDTGIQIYLCDPHSPWQRGANENTNGLLRQYMPKGTDLSQHGATHLRRMARSLNDRPRKRLGSMTPSEKLAEVLALTG